MFDRSLLLATLKVDKLGGMSVLRAHINILLCTSRSVCVYICGCEGGHFVM